MKKTLTISASVLALATLLFAATPAMARVDVGVHIGVPIYMQPQPVYVQPRPVYVRPQPVYVDRHYYRHYDKHHHKHYRKHYRHDRDRDGVPNRYDRRPNNPYRY